MLQVNSKLKSNLYAIAVVMNAYKLCLKRVDRYLTTAAIKVRYGMEISVMWH